MDSIVTARVPAEIKEQGNQILSQIGSTPTKLVNAAYDYVIEHRELPGASTSTVPRPGVRHVGEKERAELLGLFSRTSCDVSEECWNEVLQGRSYKDALADWRWEDYETLG